MQKRLDSAKDLLKQAQGLSVVSSKGGKTLKSGELQVEIKSDSRDGGKTGTITALYKGISGWQEIAKATYGGGQGQFNNIFNAIQDIQQKTIMKLQRQVGEWEQIAKKYK